MTCKSLQLKTPVLGARDAKKTKTPSSCSLKTDLWVT